MLAVYSDPELSPALRSVLERRLLKLQSHGYCCVGDKSHIRDLLGAEKLFPAAILPYGPDLVQDMQLLRAADPDIALIVFGVPDDGGELDFSGLDESSRKMLCIPDQMGAAEPAAEAALSYQRLVARLASAHDRLATQEADLARLIGKDPLTGALNRTAFLQEVDLRLAARAEQVAVCLVDIDSFKNLNDTGGHVAGDELIRLVHAALVHHLAQSGRVNPVIARFGDDEFAIVFDVTTPLDACALARDLVRACSRNFHILHDVLWVSLSAGLAIAQADEAGPADALELLRLADLALIDAKRHGPGQMRLFDDRMDTELRFRQMVEQGLRYAMVRNELSLVFQPIFSRSPFEIVGFEALLRWTDPEHGPISPSIFIPMAEESNLILELGDWVVKHALLECRKWPGQYVSINFSPRQFRRRGFFETLTRQVAEAGIDPCRVQIEITETAIFDDAGQAGITLQRLKALGFMVALDDFGSGYSNLYNIWNFPISCLKIDKAFVDGLGLEAHAAVVIDSIARLARAMDLEVVAEGVETRIQDDHLGEIGCSHVQGYFFGRPVDAEQAALLSLQKSWTPDGEQNMDLCG